MESWVHVTPLRGVGDGTVEITVDANTGSGNRTALIDVETSTLNKNLVITQKGEDMALNKISFLFNSISIQRIYMNNVPFSNTGTDGPQAINPIIKESTLFNNDTTSIIVAQDAETHEYFYCNYIKEVDSDLELTFGTHKIKLSETDGVTFTY